MFTNHCSQSWPGNSSYISNVMNTSNGTSTPSKWTSSISRRAPGYLKRVSPDIMVCPPKSIFPIQILAGTERKPTFFNSESTHLMSLLTDLVSLRLSFTLNHKPNHEKNLAASLTIHVFPSSHIRIFALHEGHCQGGSQVWTRLGFHTTHSYSRLVGGVQCPPAQRNGFFKPAGTTFVDNTWCASSAYIVVSMWLISCWLAT